jgi:hypothetical protein
MKYKGLDFFVSLMHFKFSREEINFFRYKQLPSPSGGGWFESLSGTPGRGLC